jgi:hypothetical protein
MMEVYSMKKKGCQVFFVKIFIALIFVGLLAGTLWTTPVNANDLVPPFDKVHQLATTLGTLNDKCFVMQVDKELEIIYTLVSCNDGKSVGIIRRDATSYFGVGTEIGPDGQFIYAIVDIATQSTEIISADRASKIAYAMFREMVSLGLL